MPTEPITHFVFVDFENVPTVDLSAISGHPVHITLLIGKNQQKLALALVRQIHRLGPQVELLEVGASGRNALDLTLAYYLGQAAQRTPGAQFYIVSKDKDFEPMISHLLGKNVKVTRCDSFAALPFLSPPRRSTAAPFVHQPKAAVPARSAAALQKPPGDRRTKVTARLKNPANRNRPSTVKALFAHIKASFGKEATDAEAKDIVRELGAEGVFTSDAKGRVVWAAPQ